MNSGIVLLGFIVVACCLMVTRFVILPVYNPRMKIRKTPEQRFLIWAGDLHLKVTEEAVEYQTLTATYGPRLQNVRDLRKFRSVAHPRHVAEELLDLYIRETGDHLDSDTRRRILGQPRYPRY